MSTTTTFLALTKPDPGEAGWGPMLNTNLDDLDALFAAGPVLLVAKGGTGLATLTANRIPYGNGTSAFQSSTGLTFDGTTFKTLAAHFLGSAGAPAGQVYIKSAAAGTIGLVVDTAASPSVNAQEWRLNGAKYLAVNLSTSAFQVILHQQNLGNDVPGPALFIQRNTSAGAVGPAAGALSLSQADVTARYFWADATGKLRINTAAPTGSSGAPTVSDTAGAVVGDQTSWYEFKDVLGPTRISPAEALAAVVATPIFDFRYKESSYLDADNQPAVFTGIVGFDRRDPFLKNVGRQQIPALNEVSLFGHLVLSIQALHGRITALEGKS